jgi:hemerythrin
MEKIKWKNDFSINVPVIDEEHKLFILIINKAIVAMQKNNEREKISDALNEMTLYALSHFKNEEEYMMKFDYPEYLLHKKEHSDFLMATVDFCKSAMNKNYHISDDLFKYLKKWLEEHIQKTDRKLTECFNKNGLN